MLSQFDSTFRFLQLCFSYKGKMRDSISFQISFTDKSGNDQRSWRQYKVTTIPADEKWHSLCMNVHDEVLHDVYLNTKADLRYQIYVERISLRRVSELDLYIDDIFVWRDAVLGKFSLRNCLEKGAFILQTALIRVQFIKAVSTTS